MGANPNDVFISVITLGELDRGVLLLPDGRRKRTLELWVKGIEEDYVDRILAVDREIARLWAELTVAAHRKGESIHVSDGLIAATAIRHGLRVMTRNTKPFVAAGAMILNPWDD
jgi:predicted nucleic acid-binding protein